MFMQRTQTAAGECGSQSRANVARPMPCTAQDYPDTPTALLEPNAWPHGSEVCGIHGRVLTILLRTPEGAATPAALLGTCSLLSCCWRPTDLVRVAGSERCCAVCWELWHQHLVQQNQPLTTIGRQAVVCHGCCQPHSELKLDLPRCVYYCPACSESSPSLPSPETHT